MKKYISACLFFVLISSTLVFFYISHGFGYKKHNEYDAVYIEHPEFLPQSEQANIVSFGFQKLSADMYWIKAIQYIGANVISEEYKKYLFVMMNLITDLDPYFSQVYAIGQLLLPDDHHSTWESTYNLQAKTLGKKWIEHNCDGDAVDRIFEQNDLYTILHDPLYANPCQDYRIPYYQWFIEYFYFDNYSQAAQYYKLVSAQKDAPDWAKNLVAIMTGKWAERDIAVRMFLSLAQDLTSQDDACSDLSMRLENAYEFLQSRSTPIPSSLIEELWVISKAFMPVFSEKIEAELMQKTQCTNYLLRSIREINLLYLEQAWERYLWDAPTAEDISPDILLKKGYIDIIPQDFQKYTDSDRGIIYFYDPNIQGFDYKMWRP